MRTFVGNWWRGLPLRAYGLDLALLGAVFGAVTVVLAVGWMLHDRAQRDRMAPQWARFSLADCPTLGDARLLAFLSSAGEPRERVAGAPLDGDQRRQPSWRYHQRGAASRVDLVLDPRDGQRVALDALTIERALGCRVSDFSLRPFHLPSSPEQIREKQAEMIATVAMAGQFAMLVAAGLTLRIRGRGLPRLPARGTRTRAICLGVMAGLALQLLLIGAGSALAALGVAVTPANLGPLRAMFAASPWLMLGLALVVAPVVEELLFRHLLLRRFALAARPLTGLVITALLFSALHERPFDPGTGWANWPAGVLYVAAGLAFGAVYLWSGRLSAAIAAHATSNLAAVLLGIAGGTLSLDAAGAG